jgi:hypothetical protein
MTRTRTTRISYLLCLLVAAAVTLFLIAGAGTEYEQQRFGWAALYMSFGILNVYNTVVIYRDYLANNWR